MAPPLGRDSKVKRLDFKRTQEAVVSNVNTDAKDCRTGARTAVVPAALKSVAFALRLSSTRKRGGRRGGGVIGDMHLLRDMPGVTVPARNCRPSPRSSPGPGLPGHDKSLRSLTVRILL